MVQNIGQLVIKAMKMRIGEVFEYKDYGYDIRFFEDLLGGVTKRTIKFEEKSYDLIATKSGLIVGVDTGTMFSGPTPSTGINYGITYIAIRNGNIDFNKSRAVVALRDRYDGEFKEGNIYEVCAFGYSPFLNPFNQIPGDSRGESAKRILGSNIREVERFFRL